MRVCVPAIAVDSPCAPINFNLILLRSLAATHFRQLHLSEPLASGVHSGATSGQNAKTHCHGDAVVRKATAAQKLLWLN
jgi:hypothetical protein